MSFGFHRCTECGGQLTAAGYNHTLNCSQHPARPRLVTNHTEGDEITTVDYVHVCCEHCRKDELAELREWVEEERQDCCKMIELFKTADGKAKWRWMESVLLAVRIEIDRMIKERNT